MQNTTSGAERAALQARIEEAGKHILQQGRQLNKELRQLEKDAIALKDDALIGNVYFICARSNLYKEDFDRMMVYLRKALHHLLRSEDNETLSRVFNLFAVNAQRLGCYDIAYNYYLMGRSFVESDKNSLSCAVIDANLADLYAEMGEFQKACVSTRRALPSLKRNRTDVMSDQNIRIVTVNLALYHLYANQTDKARIVIRPIANEASSDDADASSQAALWYLLFQTFLSHADGKKRQVRILLEDVISRIVSTSSFAFFMKDTHRLCRSLMASGDIGEAGKLIRAIEKNDLSEASTYSRLLLSQLQIDFYKATGNRRKLRESYLRRHALTELHRQEEKEIYRESVQMMFQMESLRQDREQETLKNQKLQQLSETDALTGLPNRYALNRAMDAAFERATTKGTPVGVGIVDIDFFKQYNDRYGHQKGDDCLCMVADALKELKKEYPVFAARYGGDEFVLLYEGMTKEELASLDKTLARRMPVSVSQGFYVDVPDADTRLWDFFARADEHLYTIKNRSR